MHIGSDNIRGHYVEVTEADGAVYGEVTYTDADGVEYTGSINRLRNIDGCLENEHGETYEVRGSVIAAISDYCYSLGA